MRRSDWPATGLSFVCFFVINPINRVDLGIFCFINFPAALFYTTFHPPPPQTGTIVAVAEVDTEDEDGDAEYAVLLGGQFIGYFNPETSVGGGGASKNRNTVDFLIFLVFLLMGLAWGLFILLF